MVQSRAEGDCKKLTTPGLAFGYYSQILRQREESKGYIPGRKIAQTRIKEKLQSSYMSG